MAMTETTQDPSQTGRRRPFTTWVKKLTHFKGGASSDSPRKRNLTPIKIAPKKRSSKNNNPYPLSGRLGVMNDPNRFDNDSNSNSNSNRNGGGSGYYSTSQQRHAHHHRIGSQPSFTSQSAITSSSTSLGRSRRSSYIDAASDDGRAPPTAGAQSMAPTVSTDRDAPGSVLAPSNGAASSITGTNQTINGAGSRRGGDSTFSSPAPSVRSLTTTLTTIQSLAPGGMLGGGGGAGNGTVGGAPSIGGTSGAGMSYSAVQPGTNYHHGHSHHHHHQHHASQQSNGTQTIHFHQPFPSAPASAIPSHLTPLSGTAGPGHPTTYSAATANNLLTDNASILTLASSSKRRRRRSFDTDASVRALAPSSLFGGSRESLPLSVLSANIEGSSTPLVPSASASSANNAAAGGPGGPGGPGGLASNNSSMPTTPGLPLHATSSRMSVASAGVTGSSTAPTTTATAAAAERTSIYSATGITGVGSDRNGFYARQSMGGGNAGVAGDGASIRSGRSGRSGLLGHGRSESTTGSIGGSLTSPLASPLASPRETAAGDATAAAAPRPAATNVTFDEAEENKPEVDGDEVYANETTGK